MINMLLNNESTAIVVRIIFTGGEPFVVDHIPFRDLYFDYESFFKRKLDSGFKLHPSWEALCICVVGEYRRDMNSIRAYVGGTLLARQKRRIRTEMSKFFKDYFVPVNFDWISVPDDHLGHVPLMQTYARDIDGSWIPKDVPKERSIYARVNPHELGIPGGRCQVLFNVEDSTLPDYVKEDILTDLSLGKDLSNEDAAKIYGGDVVRLDRSKLFTSLHLTNHAKYRMDLRSIPLDAVQLAFEEFEKWYNHKKQNPDKLKTEDRRLLEDMVYGDPVRFEAQRVRLTVVFKVLRDKSCRLVSCWWSNKPTPPKSDIFDCKRSSLEDDNIYHEGCAMNDSLEKILRDLRQIEDRIPQHILVKASYEDLCDDCEEDDEDEEYDCYCGAEEDEDCECWEFDEECDCDDDDEDCDCFEDYDDDEEGGDESDVEAARRKKRRRSDAKTYLKHRKRYRKNRRRINRQRKRKRRNPSYKRREKRLMRRRKNRAKGRQRRSRR